MEIKVVDSIEKLLFYREEWESILKEMNNDIVSLELDWIICWWRFFGDRHRLFVLLVINNQEVAGICPLISTKKGMCNEIDFIGGRESCRMDFILRDKFREEAMKCIIDFLRRLRGRNIIKFHGVSEKSVNYTLMKKLLKEDQAAFITNSNDFYFIKSLNTDFNIHLENRFGKAARYTMSKKEKKLRALGSLVYKKISLAEIDGVFMIHEKRWLRKIGNSSFSKGATREFYKNLAEDKSAKFCASISAVTLNNRIISFIYGLEYNGRTSLIRIAHDDDFYFLSPGELVWKKKLEECFLSQVRLIDFGPGYEPYKARWTNDCEKVFSVLLPSGNLLSVLIFYIQYLTGTKLKAAIKSNKGINNFRRQYLSKLKLLVSKEHIIDTINRLKRTIARNGLGQVILNSFTGLAGRVFIRKQYLILVKYLKSAAPPQSSLHVREATTGDLDALSEMMNESASMIIRRFVNKHECYLVLYNGKIVFYCWINCSELKISGLELDLPFENSDVHIYEVFTENKYRGAHSHIEIYSSVFHQLHKKNYKRCYITLDCGGKAFDSEVHKEIFSPRYKILEQRLFGNVKHSITNLE